VIRVEYTEPPEVAGSIAAVTLARPEKRNALTPEMLGSLASTFEHMPREIGAVVVSGDGAVFCAGFDLKQCAADPSGETMRSLLAGLSVCVSAMRALERPVVLGVHGSAVAGGCALLGGADVVVAERSAQLGYPVVRIGVSPAVSAPFLGASVAPGAARARLVDPGVISAGRAMEIGLVHELCDGPGQTKERAADIARSLACKPGVGVRATKSLLNHITSPITDRAQDGLGASLSLTGGDEERDRLGALWS